MMKYIIIVTLLFTATTFAQKGERIKALKTAHITNALDLSASEAEKFWPVYNAHEEKMATLRRTERREMFEVVKTGIDQITDAEANALIEKGIQMKTTELEYHKELVANLRGVIPPTKILKLRKAEEEFKRKLLELMKNRRGNRNKQP